MGYKPLPTDVLVTDIYGGNYPVNFDLMAAWRSQSGNRIAGVYAKSGYGKVWDSRFDLYRSEAIRRAILFGSYHWFYARLKGNDAAEQRRKAIIRAKLSQLPPAIDIEDLGDAQVCTPQQIHDRGLDFANALADATGRAPIIYTGAWYWGKYCKLPSGGFSPGWLKFLLWAAQYEVLIPMIYNPWRDAGLSYTLWQYGDKEKDAGREDMNVFHGSMRDLYAMAHVPFPGINEPQYQFYKVTSSIGLTNRAKPNNGATRLGVMKYGQVFTVVETVNVGGVLWGRLNSPVESWSCLRWAIMV